MDARPQRPTRAFRAPGDENAAPLPLPSSKPTIHQRHKSTGTLSSMLAAGGLKATAKRTAFGDVSNTARNLTNVQDDSAIPSKQIYEMAKSNLPADKSTAFLRPAQRHLNAAPVKGALNNLSSVPSDSVSSLQPRASVADFRQPSHQPPTNKQPAMKRGTTIFKDADVGQENILPLPPANKLTSAPNAPTRQTVESGPVAAAVEISMLKHTQATLPQLPDKAVDNEDKSNVAVSGVDGPRDVIAKNVDAHSHVQEVEKKAAGFPLVQENLRFVTSVPVIDRRSLPAPPVGSDSEDRQEQEEEEYDEDYATAHSYRSRGENTTGGMTMIMAPHITNRTRQELAEAKLIVDASRSQEEIEDEAWDTSMVAEYGDEIFAYMRELEVRMLPNPYYMDNQAEIQWSMRAVLMDWLIQVHHRFALLPETLFLCVNYIDRFLSCKVVSLGKLQLVGATAIFVAAKYEEINCPSVGEIVYMVDGGYSVDEILKAERYMLSMLQFELGWPGPMSFLRRISKADDYDLETRTLAKYFLEITIMDERYVGSPPSYVAAGAHALARFMLRKGDWSAAHAYYSGYTWNQLRPLVVSLVDCCRTPQVHHQAVFDKYSDRRYKRASKFVQTEMEKGFVLPANQFPYLRPSIMQAPQPIVAPLVIEVGQ